MRSSTTALLILAQLCFASLPVAGRIAYGKLALPPDAVVIVRMAGGCLAFLTWARLSGQSRPVERRDWLMIAVCSLLGTVLNQMLFLHGLAHLPREAAATTASLMGSTIPVFAAVFAVLLGKEPFRRTRALGIVLALAGSLTLVDFSRLSLGGESVLGNVMVLCNCASYGLFLVLVRSLSGKYPPVQLVGLMFVVGTVCTAPFGVAAWLDYGRFDGPVLAILAFILVVPTIGAYTLTQIGLQRAESSAVATFIYLQPVFASVGAFLLLGERPGPRVGLAAALIFAGVWVSTRRDARTSRTGDR